MHAPISSPRAIEGHSGRRRVDAGCGWAMSQPCTAKVVLGTPQCAPAATQRLENSSSHWVFVFTIGFFDKISILCESMESFGMNLIGNRLAVPEQCLDCPTSDGGSNGHTPGAPPHTSVVILMRLGYHAKNGPAIKARRPKPRSLFQAFHILCCGSGIRSSLHQRSGGFIQANGLVNVPTVGRAHAVRAVSQRQSPGNVVDDAIAPGA